MRSKVFVTLTCDHCGVDQNFVLQENERSLSKRIAAAGWIVENDKDYCSPECFAEATNRAGIRQG